MVSKQWRALDVMKQAGMALVQLEPAQIDGVAVLTELSAAFAVGEMLGPCS
jgi:hypothetical protein